MIHMTLAQVANMLELNPISANPKFHGISIDTRNIQPGNLFVALPGARVNGHDFIEEAYQQGAAAALVTHKINSLLPQLEVKDTAAALGQLGGHWRNQFDIPFVAVTGSNGKTTLKNMITSILVSACQGDDTKVLATLGTLNNHLGLPLTLARLNQKHRYGVIEMGMSHFGEINYLTQLTQPKVAAITNAAAAHLEGVGDVSGVARAKAEIFSGLAKDGMAVLNRDDAFFSFWQGIISQHSYLTFGFHPDADVKATLKEVTTSQKIILHTPQGHIDLHLPLLGHHNVLNALAATAATLIIGIDLHHIKHGLEKIRPAPGRLQLYTLTNDVHLIDDTYNANPFSLQAAINTLTQFIGKKILVLGDMKELGVEAKLLHQAAGENIRQAGIDYLFTFGELSANTASTFGEGAFHFNEQEKLINALKPFLCTPVTILVKGSRSMQMEKVIKGLMTENVTS